MSLAKHSIPPSYAWLTVFIPALAYFVGSRLQDTRFSGRSLGTLVQDQLQIHSLENAKEIFYLNSKDNRLTQSLNLVQSQGLEDMVDTIWKHDEELGRGFLLVSQAANAGRIWRWEVGGGPIAIGKTLHMEPSGCRSNILHNCSSSSSSNNNTAEGTQRWGSGGLALDFGSQPTSAEGRLVVSEWGEQRIVRMEESGARTPLIIQVPSLCHPETQRRIYQPNSLLYTPYGDLIVADYDMDCSQASLYYLDNAMTIQPLSSTLESRKAHAWTTTQNHDIAVKIFYTSPSLTAIGGLALDSTWTGLYATTKTGNTIQLLHMHLNGDDDEQPLWNGRSDVVYEWNSVDQEQLPGPVVVDQKGYIYAGIEKQLTVLTHGVIVASMDLPARATSLTLGQDGFLYVTTASDLYRIKVRNQPLKVPTNLVVKSKK
jgi:sugar lactone lactonase YvrE